MKITVASVGRFRSQYEKALWEDYAKRIPWKVTLKEVEARKAGATPQRMGEEANLLKAAAAKKSYRIALDGRGKQISSEALAGHLKKLQHDYPEITFFIGGADGLLPEIVQEADMVLSLGTMTWPHMLVRVMLIEQIYRAYTQLQNHPYHRA